MRDLQELALGMFESQGFDSVTVEDVAASGGVSASTIYRYFGTKERLITWDETDNDLEADVRKLLPAIPIGPDSVLPERLSVTLDAAGYGGILYVTSEPGEGPAAERVDIHVITVPEAPKVDGSAGSHHMCQPMRTAA